MKIEEGQCGMCAHFGEHHPQQSDLVELRKRKSADENYKDECGHPMHAPLHLVVTATSGCDGFAPVRI